MPNLSNARWNSRGIYAILAFILLPQTRNQLQQICLFICGIWLDIWFSDHHFQENSYTKLAESVQNFENAKKCFDTHWSIEPSIIDSQRSNICAERAMHFMQSLNCKTPESLNLRFIFRTRIYDITSCFTFNNIITQRTHLIFWVMFLKEKPKINISSFQLFSNSIGPWPSHFLKKKSQKVTTLLYTVGQVCDFIKKLSKNDKFVVHKIQSSEILDFKTWWLSFFKKCYVSDETKGKKVRKDKKQYFSVSKFTYCTYDKKFPPKVIGRPFIDSIMNRIAFPLM